MRRSIGLLVFLTRGREYFALGATAALEIRGVLPRREGEIRFWTKKRNCGERFARGGIEREQMN